MSSAVIVTELGGRHRLLIQDIYQGQDFGLMVFVMTRCQEFWFMTYGPTQYTLSVKMDIS